MPIAVSKPSSSEQLHLSEGRSAKSGLLLTRSFLFGYDTGQISGFLLFEDFRNRFGTGTNPVTGATEWVPIIQSTMVSLMSVGTLIGALSGA